MRVTTGPFSLSSRYNGQGFRKAWSVYGSTVEVGVLIIEAITVVSPVDQDRCWGLTLTANVTIARRNVGDRRRTRDLESELPDCDPGSRRQLTGTACQPVLHCVTYG